MKKVVIELDYKCFPLWIYEGEVISNDMIYELKDDSYIENLLANIQKTYDSLFIDNEQEFAYKGFASLEDKLLFVNQIEAAVKYIKANITSAYDVVVSIDYDDL